MKVVADDKIPFLKGVLEKKGVTVNYLPGGKILPEIIADADALIVRTRTICNQNLLSNSKVKFIATATIGFDHIDTQYCEFCNIKWTNAPGCNSSSVMQYIASALLSIAQDQEFKLNEKTIAIIGVGNVGSKVKKLADILGMKTLLVDLPRERAEKSSEFVSFKDVLNNADIITFHVPLNFEGEDKTYHLADSGFFAKIKKPVILFNSSRGEVVETQALKNAIRTGIISTAVIDVWENEPDIDFELMRLAKFATPHIAGYSTDGKANGTAMSVQALSRYFKLGLDEWYPENIPIPQNTEIMIDCSGKNVYEVITQAVKTSYDISEDDVTLRESPDAFEKQRGDYPVRREFPAWTVKLKNDSTNFAEILKRLGFNLIKL